MSLTASDIGESGFTEKTAAPFNLKTAFTSTALLLMMRLVLVWVDSSGILATRKGNRKPRLLFLPIINRLGSRIEDLTQQFKAMVR
jgi:hypothetical protein